MNNRKQLSTERYCQIFNEIGPTDLFEYVEFVRKGYHRFKCKKCGTEFQRADDLFRGKQKTIRCLVCNNGMKIYSQKTDEILSYYQNGHSVTETCTKFGIAKTILNNWVKKRKVTNGRTFKEGGQECNKARAEAASGSHISKSYYRKALEHGAQAEIGVTRSNLIKRKGLTCAICGIQCVDSGNSQAPLYATMDHIIPLSKGGGHTWKNVQIAHRICNLNKRDLIGKEWNNAD